MPQQLLNVFDALGINQYIDVFRDQGFDTWDTILDITESDLDALGVKLGHRRKLQRRIANFRGVAPDTSLVSPTNHSAEDARQETPRADAPPKNEVPAAPLAAAKRKYRRHPKPDENAPERPPSAYVLFSNKMREDLKDRNLTFTEIAKLVGENWQALSVAEKEPFETQAQNAKDKYNNDMAEYKKTQKHKNYLLYLQDFRAKHAGPSHDKDGGGSKRVKLSDGNSGMHLMASNSQEGPRRARSQTASASSSVDGRSSKRNNSDRPPTREQRVNSSASLPDLGFVASSLAPAALRSASIDEEDEDQSPPPHDGPNSPHEGPSSAWSAPSEAQQHQVPESLPPLSKFLDTRHTDPLGPASAHHHLHGGHGSPGSPPGHTEPQAPSLRHDYSSGESTASSAAGNSYPRPRTPSEGSSLPIHLLLSGAGPSGTRKRSASPPEARPAQQHPLYHSHASSSHSSEPPLMARATSGTPPLPPPFMLHPAGYFPAAPRHSSPGRAIHTAPVPGDCKLPQLMFNGVGPRQHQMGPSLPGLPNLDGMTALLKAGELVDRQAR